MSVTSATTASPAPSSQRGVTPSTRTRRHVIVHGEAGGRRERACLPPGCVQPARERRLAVRQRLRLDARAGGSDGGLRVRPATTRRHYGATSQPADADHWGFAWSPKNTRDAAADFDAQSGQIIHRLASAIHDSDQLVVREQRVRNRAELVCHVDRGCRVQRRLEDVRVPAARTRLHERARRPSAPARCRNRSRFSVGARRRRRRPTSPSRSRSEQPGRRIRPGTRAWSATLRVTVPAGVSTSPAVSYRDTRAGSAVITAAATATAAARRPRS